MGDVDLVWHEHILDTKNYEIDCMRLYGRFLNHRRARTPLEFAAIPESYARTKHRYAERFGAVPPARFWGAETDASSMCGGGEPPAGFQQAPAPSSNSSGTNSDANGGNSKKTGEVA